eukprot:403345397
MDQENIKAFQVSQKQIQINDQNNAFNFQAFKEILDEIDKQNLHSITSQVQKGVSFNKNDGKKLNKQQALNQQSRNFDQNQRQIFANKLNQESGELPQNLSGTMGNNMFSSSQNYQTYLETVSTFDKNFVITETTTSKQIAATYMKLNIQDLPLIIDAINNNTDMLRLFFGCKALRKILSTGNEYTIKEVISSFQFLGKRLVHLLMMPQNQELQIEILWALINLTSLKDNSKMNELIEFGLFESIVSMVDEELECVQKSELSLQVICNSIADQDKSKSELIQVEQVKGQLRLSIKDKIDMMLDKIEDGLIIGEQIQVYEELLLQLSTFIESYLHSYKILSKKLFRWLVITNLRIFQLRCNQQIIDSCLVSFKTAAQNNEYANHILFKHSKRKEILQKLVALSENLETYQIAYNSLLILGNLASSQHFKESCLVLDSDIYSAFIRILSIQNEDQSPLSNQYLHILIWTISNLIADDEICQKQLLQNFQQLIVLTINKGMQSQSQKVIKETLVVLDNILDIENISSTIFGYKEIYETILANYSYPLFFNESSIQLQALKSLNLFIGLNPNVLTPYLFNTQFNDQRTLKAIELLQYSPHKDVYDYAQYIIKRHLQTQVDASEIFIYDFNQQHQPNQFGQSGLVRNRNDQQVLSNSSNKMGEFSNKSSNLGIRGSKQNFGEQKPSFSAVNNNKDYMIMQIDDE